MLITKEGTLPKTHDSHQPTFWWWLRHIYVVVVVRSFVCCCLLMVTVEFFCFFLLRYSMIVSHNKFSYFFVLLLRVWWFEGRFKIIYSFDRFVCFLVSKRFYRSVYYCSFDTVNVTPFFIGRYNISIHDDDGVVVAVLASTDGSGTTKSTRGTQKRGSK